MTNLNFNINYPITGTTNTSGTITYSSNDPYWNMRAMDFFKLAREAEGARKEEDLSASPEEVEAEFGVEFGDIVILGLGDKIVEFILYNVVRAYETEEYFFQDSQGNSYGMDSWTLISENESDTLDS